MYKKDSIQFVIFILKKRSDFFLDNLGFLVFVFGGGDGGGRRLPNSQGMEIGNLFR
jgi:hypothetical protein